MIPCILFVTSLIFYSKRQWIVGTAALVVAFFAVF